MDAKKSQIDSWKLSRELFSLLADDPPLEPRLERDHGSVSRLVPAQNPLAVRGLPRPQLRVGEVPVLPEADEARVGPKDTSE